MRYSATSQPTYTGTAAGTGPEGAGLIQAPWSSWYRQNIGAAYTGTPPYFFARLATFFFLAFSNSFAR